MTSYLPLQTRAVTGKGRGVFSAVEVFAGELIESAELVIVPESQCKAVEGTVLGRYMFMWGPDSKDGAIALGFGSLYNHSETPNADHFMDLEHNLITFVANRDIPCGEEITINYQADSDVSRALPFEVV